MSKIWWTAAASAAAALATAAFVTATDSSGTPDDGMLVLVGQGTHRDDPLHFQLRGKPVKGLYPGAVKQMRITVVNPLGFRLRVQSLSAQVSGSNRRGCHAESQNLQIRQFSRPLPITVPVGRTDLSGFFPITMPRGAPRTCAGARFTITISGVGRRVTR
jgi:hypothetical protein